MAAGSGQAIRSASSLFWDLWPWDLLPCPKRAGFSLFLLQEAQSSASSYGFATAKCSKPDQYIRDSAPVARPTKAFLRRVVLICYAEE